MHHSCPMAGASSLSKHSRLNCTAAADLIGLPVSRSCWQCPSSPLACVRCVGGWVCWERGTQHRGSELNPNDNIRRKISKLRQYGDRDGLSCGYIHMRDKLDTPKHTSFVHAHLMKTPRRLASLSCCQALHAFDFQSMVETCSINQLFFPSV